MTVSDPTSMYPTKKADDSAVFHTAVWSADLETGIHGIDDQHKRFFEIAASFSGENDQVRVMKTLVLLTGYIRVHFSDEEKLMSAAQYPNYEAHCRLHAQFRYMLSDLLSRARTMSLDEIAAEVRYLINGWFYNHILVEDFDYVPFLVSGHLTSIA